MTDLTYYNSKRKQPIELKQLSNLSQVIVIVIVVILLLLSVVIRSLVFLKVL